jgi:hypothetical protein
MKAITMASNVISAAGMANVNINVSIIKLMYSIWLLMASAVAGWLALQRQPAANGWLAGG